MAQITAYRCASGEVDGPVTIIVPQEVPRRCCAGKYLTLQVFAMAGATGIGVLLVEILMLQIPVSTVEVVPPVRAIQGRRQPGMAGTALANGAGMPLQLQLHGRDHLLNCEMLLKATGATCIPPCNFPGS